MASLGPCPACNPCLPLPPPPPARRLQLYSHGAELFADDEAAAAVLQRHLLRGVGAECVDALLRYLHADAAAGQEDEEAAKGGDAAALADAAAGPLTPAQRSAVLKQLPPDVRPAAAAAVDKLNGAALEVGCCCLLPAPWLGVGSAS